MQGIKLTIIARHTGKLLEFKIKNYESPMFIRGKTSDSYILNNNIICREYEGLVSFTPQTVLDCGANIGLSSRYWHMQYPGADIVAIEPDPDNYQILLKNTVGIKEISCINGGLWSKQTKLSISNPGSDKYSVQVKEDNDKGSIEAYSVESIMAKYSWAHIDILKIDIEGAEEQLFAENTESWIDCVNVIIMELHQSVSPKAASYLFAAFANKPYKLSWRGENLILTRDQIIL